MRIGLAVAMAVLVPASAAAQNSVVEFTEDALNKLVDLLGNPSDAGVHIPTVVEGLGGFEDCEFFGFLSCSGLVAGADPGFDSRIPLVRCRTRGGWRLARSGDPVRWHWWVSGAHFDVVSASMRFRAKVRYRVGEEWDDRERTVEAGVDFDRDTQLLKLALEEFEVPLRYEWQGVVQEAAVVDVAKIYGLSVRLHPQILEVPTPAGPKTVTARAAGIAPPQYLEGKVRVDVDLGFE